jgi:glycosyltransferase involved in cell wall biosynthesis
MSAEQPLVSVVVPTYNGARFLDATLRSLGAQTHGNLEVIVVDDGSTDDTLGVARASAVPASVVVQQNLGVAVARNRGLAQARGQWVGFVDQDDLWRRDRVSSLVEHANRHELKAVASTEHPFALDSDREALRAVGDGRDRWPRDWIDDGAEDALVDTASQTPPGPPERIGVERLMQGAAMLTTSVLYDRETALAAGGFAPHARALDDHLLNLNVARIAGPIERIDTRDLLYRVHPSSTSTVSPMAGPLLSGLASVRLGGIFPPTRELGSNVEHLLRDLPGTALPAADQLALLLLTVPRGSRAVWVARWAKHALRQALPGGRR